MPYRSNARAVKAAIRQGIDDGLTVIGQHYTQNVRGVLLSGYTTGNFSHQMRGVAGRVMYTPPYAIPGGRGISMGTSKAPGYAYELAWELGHVNIFIGGGNGIGGGRATLLGSRREGTYVRVEVWRPMLVDNTALYVNMFARNADRVFGGAAPINLGFTGTGGPR
jgi:hypothetical protein